MLKPAAIYFIIVFGVGFALGPIREWTLVPRFGVRNARLIEFPFLLIAIVCAAKWIAYRFCRPLAPWRRLGVGMITAGLVLAGDVAVGVFLRKLSVWAVFTDRDPISGSIYYLFIAVLAVLPWIFSRRLSTTQPRP